MEKTSHSEKDRTSSFSGNRRLWDLLDGRGHRAWFGAPREARQIHGRYRLCLCYHQRPWAYSWRCDHFPFNVAMDILLEVRYGDSESRFLA